MNSKNDDVGVQTVKEIYNSLQVDEEWSIREKEVLPGGQTSSNKPSGLKRLYKMVPFTLTGCMWKPNF